MTPVFKSTHWALPLPIFYKQNPQAINTNPMTTPLETYRFNHKIVTNDAILMIFHVHLVSFHSFLGCPTFKQDFIVLIWNLEGICTPNELTTVIKYPALRVHHKQSIISFDKHPTHYNSWFNHTMSIWHLCKLVICHFKFSVNCFLFFLLNVVYFKIILFMNLGAFYNVKSLINI